MIIYFYLCQIVDSGLKHFRSTVLVQLLVGKNRYGFDWAVMINLPEQPLIDKARNDTHIASTGVRLH